MRTRMLAGVTGMVLAFPGAAWADSGVISDVHAVAGGQVEATYTATSTYCTQSGYCGFFPYASQVGASEACDAYNTTGRLTFVGELQSNAGSHSAIDPFYPSTAGPLKLCLHLSQGDERKVTVAEYVYISAPTTASTPTGTQADAPPLTVAEGRASLAGLLRDKFGGRFTNRRSFKRECYRLLISTVRCRVRWDHGQWRYAGAVDMKNDPEDPVSSVVYRTTVRRTRLHQGSSGSSPSTPAPSTPAPSSPAPNSPAPTPTCDPSYKGACLKPNVSDYDCAGGSGDGPYYVQGPITVVGDDHYGLDRDGDGIACES